MVVMQADKGFAHILITDVILVNAGKQSHAILNSVTASYMSPKFNWKGGCIPRDSPAVYTSMQLGCCSLKCVCIDMASWYTVWREALVAGKFG